MGFDEQFVVIGHRGAAGLAPENTLKGFKLAERLGAHAVELDVQLVEHRLAVFHDATLERTTNGTGRLEGKSWREIQALDAGEGQSVPELVDVLAVLDARTGINIELKGKGTGLALAQFLKRQPCPHPLLVSSFHQSELAAFRAANTQANIGLLVAKRDASTSRQAAQLNVWSVHLHDRLATPDHIANLLAHGFQVLVYTVNSQARAAELRSMGARGVFTDFPDRVSG